MDEMTVYSSVPQTVWVAFVWSLIGAGIALCTLWVVQGVTWCVLSLRRKPLPPPPPVVIPDWWTVEAVEDITYTPPRKRKSKKRTARKPRKSKSAA
jgi:hypothetical protein